MTKLSSSKEKIKIQNIIKITGLPKSKYTEKDFHSCLTRPLTEEEQDFLEAMENFYFDCEF